MKLLLASTIVLAAMATAAGCRKESAPPSPPQAEEASDESAVPPSAEQRPPHPTAASRHPSILAARRALESVQLEDRKWEQLHANRWAATQPASAPAGGLEAHIADGIGELDGQNFSAAAECFRKALALNDNHQGALWGLAEALAADKKFAQAVEVYERLLRGGEDDLCRFNLAVLLSRLGRLDDAEQAYRQLLAKNADNVEARYNLAVLHQARGKLTAARDEWTAVIARAPHLPSAHGFLGEVLMDLGDAEGAMKSYASAAKLQPGEAAGWVNLSVAAEAAGSYGRALASMRNALKITPEDANLWSRQGNLLLALHRHTNRGEFLEAAIAAWRESLHLDPTRQDVPGWLRARIDSPAPATQPGS